MTRLPVRCEVRIGFEDEAWVMRVGICTSPRLAVRWMREHAVYLAWLLDPDPWESRIHPDMFRRIGGIRPDPALTICQWAVDYTAQEIQLGELAAGQPVEVVASDGAFVYALVARPLPVPAGPEPPHAASLSPAPCRG